MFYQNKNKMNERMKKLAPLFITLFSLMLATPFTSFAQGWEKVINTSERDFGISTAETQDGNFVVAGTSLNGLGTASESSIFLTKIDIHSNTLWTQSYGFADGLDYVYQVIATSDGGFLLGGRSQTNGSYLQSYLIKTDANGTEEWSNLYENVSNAPSEIRAIIESSNGDFIFTGNEDLLSHDLSIGRVDASGNLLWMNSYYANEADEGFALTETAQNEIVVTGFTNGGSGSNKFMLFKADADGNKLWSKTGADFSVGRFVHLEDNGEITTIGSEGSQGVTMARFSEDGDLLWRKAVTTGGILTFMNQASPTADGGYVMSGLTFVGNQDGAFILKLDNQGDRQWVQLHGGATRTELRGIIQTSSLEYLGVGSQNPNTLPATNNVYVVKTDSLGRLYSNIINGRIANDTSMDCLVDSSEVGLVNWIVEARKDATQSFFGSSDSLGNYEITADTGAYHLILHSPNPYWGICTDSVPLLLTEFYDTTTVDFAVQPDIECPLLVVDVATPWLRRCFDNVYTVNYCNDGTMQADSAYVDIHLDPYLNFISASIPEQMISANEYRFQLGDLAIGACGSFNFTVNVDCDSTVLGQNHCVEAHIYPDSLCLPMNPNWSGAFVEVDAECQDSVLQFTIENTGAGSMDGPLRYVIIEDAILMHHSSFELIAGESQEIPLANNGASYLIYAEQEPGAPGQSVPILSVEGCVSTPGFPFSTGFVNQFSHNDLNPFIDIDCRANRGSYDPNDKQGFPLGYGAEHFIEANTPIDYMIRFQNTGTDTAFTVVIKDTLSAWLNPASLRAGVSSHPYEFSLSGGGIATFTFNNILLPDSTTNLAGSNGFVKFRINQEADNAIDTRIENRAAIFFDFNPPIFTNTTFHTIGEDWLSIILDTKDLTSSLEDIKVYPNPLRSSALFDLGDQQIKNGQFVLYNTQGQLVGLQDFSGSTFTFERNQLSSGFYFFNIREEGKLIGKGKLIIQ